MTQKWTGHKVQSNMVSLLSQYTEMIRHFNRGILVRQHVVITKSTLNNLQLPNSKDAFLSSTPKSNAPDLHVRQRDVWCKQS